MNKLNQFKMYYSSLKEPKQREKIPQVLTTLRKVQALGRVDWHPFLAVLKPAPPLPGLSLQKRAAARESCFVHLGTQTAPRPSQPLQPERDAPPEVTGPGRRRERAAQARASWGQP